MLILSPLFFHTVQVGNQICSVIGLFETCKAHFSAGRVCFRIFQKSIQAVDIPNICNLYQSSRVVISTYRTNLTIDREVGSVSGYNYSGALVKVADVWDIDSLNGFLENPKTYAPGTKMGFAGLKKPDDRANLIAYLDSVEE